MTLMVTRGHKRLHYEGVRLLFTAAVTRIVTTLIVLLPQRILGVWKK